MIYKPPERNSLIQNSVMKVTSETEPSKCLPLLAFLMFRETAKTGGLHYKELWIMNEPHSPQRSFNGLSGKNMYHRGSQEIIYTIYM